MAYDRARIRDQYFMQVKSLNLCFVAKLEKLRKHFKIVNAENSDKIFGYYVPAYCSERNY